MKSNDKKIKFKTISPSASIPLRKSLITSRIYQNPRTSYGNAKRSRMLELELNVSIHFLNKNLISTSYGKVVVDTLVNSKRKLSLCIKMNDQVMLYSKQEYLSKYYINTETYPILHELNHKIESTVKCYPSYLKLDVVEKIMNDYMIRKQLILNREYNKKIKQIPNHERILDSQAIHSINDFSISNNISKQKSSNDLYELIDVIENSERLSNEGQVKRRMRESTVMVLLSNIKQSKSKDEGKVMSSIKSSMKQNAYEKNLNKISNVKLKFRNSSIASHKESIKSFITYKEDESSKISKEKNSLVRSISNESGLFGKSTRQLDCKRKRVFQTGILQNFCFETRIFIETKDYFSSNKGLTQAYDIYYRHIKRNHSFDSIRKIRGKSKFFDNYNRSVAQIEKFGIKQRKEELSPRNVARRKGKLSQTSFVENNPKMRYDIDLKLIVEARKNVQDQSKLEMRKVLLNKKYHEQLLAQLKKKQTNKLSSLETEHILNQKLYKRNIASFSNLNEYLSATKMDLGTKIQLSQLNQGKREQINLTLGSSELPTIDTNTFNVKCKSKLASNFIRKGDTISAINKEKSQNIGTRVTTCSHRLTHINLQTDPAAYFKESYRNRVTSAKKNIFNMYNKYSKRKL